MGLDTWYLSSLISASSRYALFHGFHVVGETLPLGGGKSGGREDLYIDAQVAPSEL